MSLSKNKKLFEIPQLRTIFKYKKNPLANHADVEKWLKDIFEFSCMDAQHFDLTKATSLFPSYYHPFCTDIERYENLFKFWMHYFVVDDHTECLWGDAGHKKIEANNIWGELLRATDRLFDKDCFVPLNRMKPYILYWFSILENMCHDLNPTASRRLVTEFRKHIKANIEETEKCSHDFDFKGFDDMVQVRVYSSGIFPTFCLIMYADGVTISDQEWDSPLFKEFIELANRVIFWHNDIVSFEKEYKDQGGQLEKLCNVVAFKAITEKITVEEAMALACDEYPKLEKRAMDTMQKLLESDASEDVKQFCHRVEYMMGGNFQSGYETQRYK